MTNNGHFKEIEPCNKIITIEDWQGKQRDYSFPTYFSKSKMALLAYSADYKKVNAMLAKNVAKPVRLFNNKCLMVFALFQYGEVSDGMQAYNEFFAGVMVSRSQIPVLPAVLRKSFKSTALYMFDMPVDAEENCHRGKVIWGLPKNLKQFEIDQSNNNLHFQVKDNNNLCFEISLPIGGKRWLPKNESNRTLSIKDGKLKASKVMLHATNLRFYTSASPLAQQVKINFGKSDNYARFNKIGLSKKPLLVRHGENINSALYAPVDYC